MAGLFRTLLRQILIVLLFVAGSGGWGATADDGETPRLVSGEQRIVSLAPHLAELVFAVGAGDRLVGVTAYTDYPDAAAERPLVGDAFAIDQEQLALLKPDLLLAWESGTPARVVDELRNQGYRIEVIRTRGIGDVANALERIGALTGRNQQATVAAEEFRRGIRKLAERYREASPIAVFYQVSNRPLYTVSGDHFVSELIGICGGHNVFADLGSLAPLVDVEAVLSRNPEVLLANSPDAFDLWHRWPQLAANRYGNRFLLPADQIARPTPRLVLAGKTLCKILDSARSNRAAEK